jgi:hypothetical protein
MQDNNTGEQDRALDFTKLLQIIAACDPSATSVRVSQMLRMFHDNRPGIHSLMLGERRGGVIVGDLEFIGAAFKLIFYAWNTGLLNTNRFSTIF